jgi:hypothetical protein
MNEWRVLRKEKVNTSIYARRCKPTIIMVGVGTEARDAGTFEAFRPETSVFVTDGLHMPSRMARSDEEQTISIEFIVKSAVRK